MIFAGVTGTQGFWLRKCLKSSARDRVTLCQGLGTIYIFVEKTPVSLRLTCLLFHSGGGVFFIPVSHTLSPPTKYWLLELSCMKSFHMHKVFLGDHQLFFLVHIPLPFSFCHPWWWRGLFFSTSIDFPILLYWNWASKDRFDPLAINHYNSKPPCSWPSHSKECFIS